MDGNWWRTFLASLRMDQAKNWKEFREACSYSHVPGENMMWADKYGDIGWQVVGIGPARESFSGLVPILGDGRYLPVARATCITVLAFELLWIRMTGTNHDD